LTRGINSIFLLLSSRINHNFSSCCIYSRLGFCSLLRC
jgi:hypothetical protein